MLSPMAAVAVEAARQKYARNRERFMMECASVAIMAYSVYKSKPGCVNLAKKREFLLIYDTWSDYSARLAVQERVNQPKCAIRTAPTAGIRRRRFAHHMSAARTNSFSLHLGCRKLKHRTAFSNPCLSAGISSGIVKTPSLQRRIEPNSSTSASGQKSVPRCRKKRNSLIRNS